MTNKIALITAAEAGAAISLDTHCLGAFCEPDCSGLEFARNYR